MYKRQDLFKLLDFSVFEINKALYPFFSFVLMPATKLPHTETAVTGTDSPSSRKRRDMPDFFPIKPMLNFISFYGATNPLWPHSR